MRAHIQDDRKTLARDYQYTRIWNISNIALVIYNTRF